MTGLATGWLALIFVIASAVTWYAGVQLSRTTDALDGRFKIGDELGGLVLLGFATSLPELAIVVSAAINGHPEIIVGNLIGGIAIQTALIGLLDALAPRNRPLTSLVSSIGLVVEAGMVIAIGVIAIGGTQLPAHVNLAGISPASAVLVVALLGGLYCVDRLRGDTPWRVARKAETPAARGASRAKPFANRANAIVLLVFAAGAIATLAAGYTLEESGNALAGRIGLSSGIFGATVLALVTALPGISTGYAAIRLGDYELTLSEIFGGNAFAPALFIFADVISGKPALPFAQPSDIWMAALGVAMTSIFVVSLVLRPRSKRWRLGPDSMIAVAAYAVGIVGLATIPGTTG